MRVLICAALATALAYSVQMAEHPANMLRPGICLSLALSLAWTAPLRAQFFELRHKYVETVGVKPLKRELAGFYTNTFGEVSGAAWPLCLVPLVNGAPKLSPRVYRSLVTNYCVETALVAAGLAPAGPAAVCGLVVAVLLLLLALGQRMGQMLGMVSGHKDVLATWTVLVLLAGELDGTLGGARVGMRWLMAATYGIPGITKLVLPRLQGRSWLSWMDGATLQCILLERTALYGNNLAKLVASYPVLCAAGSVTAVLFETLWLVLPCLAPLASTPMCLAAAGILFHLGCTLLLGINFLPMWLPTYWCLLPGPPGTPHLNIGCWTAGVLFLFAAGNAWFYAELLSSESVPEGRLWPLGIPPYYSRYCTGYRVDEEGDVEIAAVVLEIGSSRSDNPGCPSTDPSHHVSRRGSVWRPEIDQYLVRRINAEFRAAGSLQAAIQRNLLLLALVESSPRLEAIDVDSLVARWQSVSWVRKKFCLSWRATGFGIKEEEEVVHALSGGELEAAVKQALSE
eukprot:TRINITY_DN6686_c0_g1_i2.p1 TRINITY_DN6686_c0_g1~~TRINITY_DN6686_c0_g1_i2.p1  ORF type:complete len:512 (-),score=94.14 TRINITY_DN6686_c0_g1_i2:201-1736(-)